MRIGMLFDPVHRFHDVAVGVAIEPVRSVGHARLQKRNFSRNYRFGSMEVKPPSIAALRHPSLAGLPRVKRALIRNAARALRRERSCLLQSATRATPARPARSRARV